MESIYDLIGRNNELFKDDITEHEDELSERIAGSRFLVIGGAGSIGQAVVREIFRRNPRVLHVVDISENNLVELVRDIRSSFGYIDGDFATFAIDCGSDIFNAFLSSNPEYDYVMNLSALKHVRSEKDAYTLMRMIDVNILNSESIMSASLKCGAKKFFVVSTDKAANPVNMMGASKRIMELYLFEKSEQLPISSARFANVAFSDGSLLDGFSKRLNKSQPLSAPNDVKRYFVTPKESGELCLMSCILGENREIFFPKLDADSNMITFSEIAEKYLRSAGFEPVICETEEEARNRVSELKNSGKWPVYFFGSDTTGEKAFEEFYTNDEEIDLDRFKSIGIVKKGIDTAGLSAGDFHEAIKKIRSSQQWSRQDIIDLFNLVLPAFHHLETGKFLDARM